jgi:hypothetical protein
MMANEAILEMVARLRVEMSGQLNDILNKMDESAKRAKETQERFKGMSDATAALTKELKTGLSPALSAFGISSLGASAAIYGLMSKMTELGAGSRAPLTAFSAPSSIASAHHGHTRPWRS